MNCILHRFFCLSYPLIFIGLLTSFSFGCQPKVQHFHTQGQSISQASYQKIVPASIFAAEILWRLGANSRKKVLAVPAMLSDNRYSNFSGTWPKQVARFHHASEELVAFGPDLVITTSFTSPELRGLLTKAKIHTLVLRPSTGFQSYRQNVQLIAQAVGAQKQGEAIIASFEQRLLQIRKNASHIVPAKVMSYMYGYTAGKSTTFDDAVRAAGLVNLAAKQGIDQFGPVSVEQLLLWQPDIIVISCSTLNCIKAENQLASALGLEKLSAQVVALPVNILSNVNESMLAIAEILQKRLSSKQ